MVAMVFETRGHVSVFDRDALCAGFIALGGTDASNPVPADGFEDALRAAIESHPPTEV